MKPLLADIESKVLAFQRDSNSHDFDDLLREIVAYQRAWIPALDRFWRQRGFDGSPSNATDVPPVATDVFRHVRLASAEREVVRTFRTSGTTSGARGEHHKIALAAYDEGAVVHAAAMGLGAPMPWLCLTHSPADAPDSSLSHMLGLFGDRFATDVSFLLSSDGLDVARTVAALESADDPICVFGTAFAFVQLFEAWPSSVALPAGSIVVETGGFKGKSRELDREVLYGLIHDRLGVPEPFALSEYSMTELSSQLYTGTLRAQRHGSGPRALVPPHWLRVYTVDPESREPLPHGAEGLLCFVDLANLDSVVAIMTADRGVVDEDGVHLLGRYPGSTPRGCSLTVEELLRAAND